MDKWKNNKRFLNCLMIRIIIVSFICLGVHTFNTYSMADIILNPYFKGDTDRMEELTENFIAKCGGENV